MSWLLKFEVAICCNVQVIQLYETTLVRHGLMLVGPTGGGKTCNYRALGGAMSLLNDEGSEKYMKVSIWTIKWT